MKILRMLFGPFRRLCKRFQNLHRHGVYATEVTRDQAMAVLLEELKREVPGFDPKEEAPR